jgi:hypothetical protein
MSLESTLISIETSKQDYPQETSGRKLQFHTGFIDPIGYILLSFSPTDNLCFIARNGAGGQNRTDVASVEGWSFTTKLHPQKTRHIEKQIDALVVNPQSMFFVIAPLHVFLVTVDSGSPHRATCYPS